MSATEKREVLLAFTPTFCDCWSSSCTSPSDMKTFVSSVFET